MQTWGWVPGLADVGGLTYQVQPCWLVLPILGLGPESEQHKSLLENVLLQIVWRQLHDDVT